MKAEITEDADFSETIRAKVPKSFKQSVRKFCREKLTDEAQVVRDAMLQYLERQGVKVGK